MSLRKFLWGLSLSVFLAGLVYRYAGPFGLFEARGGDRPVYAGDIVGGSHRPDDRLVSPIVGRHSSFWYLTAADRSVSGGLLRGADLISWTDPVLQGAMFRDLPVSPAGGGQVSDDGAEIDEFDPSPARGVPAGPKRHD